MATRMAASTTQQTRMSRFVCGLLKRNFVKYISAASTTMVMMAAIIAPSVNSPSSVLR